MFFSKAKRTLLLILSPALVSSQIEFSAKAEPDQTIQHFMTESVRLLDFGIFRLEVALQEIRQADEQGDFGSSPAVEYDWDSNTIIISAMRFSMEFDESYCSNWFQRMRRTAGISPDFPRFVGVETSLWARLFKHNSFSFENADVEANRLSDLDKKFHLKYEVILPPGDSGPHSFICEGALLERGFSVKEP